MICLFSKKSGQHRKKNYFTHAHYFQRFDFFFMFREDKIGISIDERAQMYSNKKNSFNKITSIEKLQTWESYSHYLTYLSTVGYKFTPNKVTLKVSY